MRTLQILCLYLCCAACSKEQISETLQDGKSTVIEDLAGDTQASMSDGVDGKERRPFYIFLFRLRDQKQIWIRNAADSARYLKTLDWDLAFTGPYNSEVYVNNGTYPYNPGFGGMANSAVVKVDRPYSLVDQAPADAEFARSDINKIGWASSETAAGWFSYSISTHLMQPIKARTYLLKLPSGNYAKLQLINVYKGNPPNVTDLNWPAPYFTFRYYVQQDGSRNLNTR